MAANIKFGTDGWRGVIGQEFTFDNVRIVSQAIADYIKSQNIKQPKVAIGFDTRFLSDKFAKTCASVFSANGISVILSDRPTPTPTVSFTVQRKKLSLGIMITASHNPAEFNGLKIKNAQGGAADISVTKKVESLLYKNKPRILNLEEAIRSKKVNVLDLSCEYVRFVRAYLDWDLFKMSRAKVLVDVMYGSGNGFMAEVLKGTNIDLEFIHNEINPSFGGRRPEPVIQNLGQTFQRIKKSKFDLGLVLDGDADRIAAIEPDGRFIHPQKILGLLALHLHQDRGFSGGIVKTIAGTTMMDNIAQDLGLKLYQTPVGFKYISNLMETEDILVGGEEAGGMGFKDYIPERDGTLAGLLILEMMLARKISISRIVQEMEDRYGRFYYLRNDIELKKGEKPNIPGRLKSLLGTPVVKIEDFDGMKFIAQDLSWLMFRASGTEALVRVYSESPSLAKAKRLLDWGAHLIKK